MEVLLTVVNFYLNILNYGEGSLSDKITVRDDVKWYYLRCIIKFNVFILI